MHIWPSASIRESFKFAYLRKLEWNLQRMKMEKQQSSISQNLLDNQHARESRNADASNSNPDCGFVAFCHDLGMILSCCYCCFCCGAFVEDK